jgi:hypothetical protein
MTWPARRHALFHCTPTALDGQESSPLSGPMTGSLSASLVICGRAPVQPLPKHLVVRVGRRPHKLRFWDRPLCDRMPRLRASAGNLFDFLDGPPSATAHLSPFLSIAFFPPPNPAKRVPTCTFSPRTTRFRFFAVDRRGDWSGRRPDAPLKRPSTQPPGSDHHARQPSPAPHD